MLTRRAPRDFLRTGSGKLGTAFFLALVLISAYVLLTYPPDFGTKHWSNPAVWADYPKSVPPAWTGLFSATKPAEQQVFMLSEPTRTADDGGVRSSLYLFTTDRESDQPPTLLSLSLGGVTFYGRSPVISVTVMRPDQTQVLLFSYIVPGPSAGEALPVTRYSGTPYRVELSGNPNAIASVSEFVKSSFGVQVTPDQMAREGMLSFLFGAPQGGDFRVLKGTYTVQASVFLYDSRDSVGQVGLVLGGSAYGLLGTDSVGRDLALGVFYGFPVALFIALVTSILTSFLGTLAGIVSGYYGGKTDVLIQRIADILNNIPLLPILIFLAFIFGQKLLVVVLVLTAFGWPSMTVIIRSMVLQVRSQQFIEAAEVIGASKWTVITRHIFPQTAPYVLAQMIFIAPGAILAEAGLSFLGLGDPSIPTWGQILESGFRSGALYVGQWWWVLPPGLLIVFSAMTFVLISLGLEPIVNPRLGRRPR